MNEAVDLLFGIVFGFLCFAGFLAIWFGPAYWAVRDAHKRGKGAGVIVLLWLLLGPLSALAWLAIRPSKTILSIQPRDFSTPDEALSAAARLDHAGEWSAATRIYESVAQQWPEHRTYADRCLEHIRQKEAAASAT